VHPWYVFDSKAKGKKDRTLRSRIELNLWKQENKPNTEKKKSPNVDQHLEDL
jgi:hypothetical protein